MNTLNYIGSKHTLCPVIIDIISKEIDGLQNKSFMDLFAGTGSVGFRFQELVDSCNANDLEYYSFVINNALLKCNYSDKLRQIIEDCNQIKSDKVDNSQDLVFKNYSTNNECDRMFFSNENAKKCDAIRVYIEQLKNDNIIDIYEYYFLLGSLLVVVDKVANTSCVYGAYLKKFKASALKPFVLVPIHSKIDLKPEKNSVYNMKAEELSKTDKYFDVVYMDPPYNQRQYSANYGPLNYIAMYDSSINLTGKTGLIENYNKSDFCSKVKVKSAFKLLLDNIKCRYIFMSYNDEGLLGYDVLVELLSSYGALKLYKIPYKKFKAQQSVDGDSVFEYLWFIDKEKPSSFTETII
jgi:adenine-specific DNA-methyltransferase